MLIRPLIFGWYKQGSLISLWEIVKPFYPAVFTTLHAAYNIPGVDIMGAVFGRLDIWSDTRKLVQEGLPKARQQCVELGLIASVATIDKILALVSDPASTLAQFHELGKELRGRLDDELWGTTFFSLDTSETDYYRNPRKGWEKIIERFPDTVSDVEEARKCFALSRHSAAIFHSLQMVEIGLIELGTFIGVGDPYSGWTAVSSQLKKIVSKKYEDRTDFERKHFPFLEQIQGTVAALKNAWRNKIGHAQGRLTLMSKDFNREIAEEILFATRAFMRRLADGLPAPTP